MNKTTHRLIRRFKRPSGHDGGNDAKNQLPFETGPEGPELED